MSRPLLTPMEGVADYVMHDMLTRAGSYDGYVSEFIRVTGSLLPVRTYRRETPEIRSGDYTVSGMPMTTQLLGSDPEWLARNAAYVTAPTLHSIDLNFGCLAKVVNRHGGGAMLLVTPEVLYDIVHAVRTAVPASISVTAKMRFGVSDTSRTTDHATALAKGGVESLVVHARTRDHGYRPSAHWDWIARIVDAMSIPVAANGEVWTVADWERCRVVSGCSDIMIDRGTVSDPFLAQRTRGQMDEAPSAAEWPIVLGYLTDYLKKLHVRISAKHEYGRVKLWLSYLKRTWPQAAGLHDAIRRLQDALEIERVTGQMQLRLGRPGAANG